MKPLLLDLKGLPEYDKLISLGCTQTEVVSDTRYLIDILVRQNERIKVLEKQIQQLVKEL